MKAMKTILKILAALAFVAGLVYVVATYGERIAAWARQLLNRCCEFFGIECSCCCDCDCDGDCECDCDCSCATEEIPEEAVVAEETDFEG